MDFYKKILYFFRKLKKKHFIILLVIILIFFNTLTCHATDEVIVKNISNVDAYQFLRDQYEINWNRYVERAITYAKTHNNTFDTNFVTCMNTILNGGTQRVWYIDSINVSSFFFDSDGVTPILTDTNTICFGTCNFSNESQRREDFFTLIPSYASNMNSSRTTRIYNYTNTAQILKIDNNGYTYLINNKITIPEGLERYIPEYLYDTLRMIVNGSFDFSTTDEVLHDIDEHTQNIDTHTGNIEEFLTDDTISEYDENDLPSYDIDNPTNTAFQNIFYKFTRAIDDTGYHSVNIPLNLGGIDKSFTFDSNSLGLRQNLPRDMIAFCELIWGFVIYYYIVFDLFRFIDDLSQGKLTERVENIKTTIL